MYICIHIYIIYSGKDRLLPCIPLMDERYYRWKAGPEKATHTHTYICIYICISTHVGAYVYVDVSLYLCTYVYMCICGWVGG